MFRRKKLWIIPIIALTFVIVCGSFSCAKEEPAPISETGAKELEEAISIVGSPLPLPGALPSGYKIQRVLLPEKSDYYIEGYGTKGFWRVTLIISDKEIEGPISQSMLEWVNEKVGLFEVAGKHGIQLDLVHWESYPYSEKAYTGVSLPQEPPPPEKLFDGTKGYLEAIEGCYFIRWNLPNWDKPEFVLMMFSSQEVAREELIQIAKSIKMPK
jgi:hypothetical protein